MSFEEITIGSRDCSMTVAPSRGALVTRLVVANRDVLYLDRASFEDPTKNVRGGIPVLFPYAGKLAGETFLAAGTKMKQHGFGRNKAWSVVARTASAITMRLLPDAETRAVYPFEFRADMTCTILVNGLLVELLIENRSEKPLPVSPGWHPYFTCPADAKAKVRGNVRGLGPDSFGDDREFDFGLLPPVDGRTTFDLPGAGPLAIAFSPEMRHMQFWSQPTKPFICLEPFFGPNDTVNTDRRLDIAPGAARVLWMKIEV